jgi:hypothetical protein
MGRMRRKRYLLVFAIALAARILFLLYTVHSRPAIIAWGGNEYAAITRSLLSGHGFSGAFHDAPFPTAWMAPGYTLVLAAIFSLFGVYSKASVVAAMVLNALLSSATAMLIFRFGEEQFGSRCGYVAALLWSGSYPVILASFLPGEAALAGLCFLVALRATFGLTSRFDSWARCGALWGLCGLVSPALLALLPAVVIYLAIKSGAYRALVLTLACALMIAPWTIRNALVLGRLIPVKSNFWAEIYFGNLGFADHPTGSSMLYQHMGELGFTDYCRTRVVQYVRTHPKEFARATLRRVWSFWTAPGGWWGLPILVNLAALAGAILIFRSCGWQYFPLLAALFFYPLVYYLCYTYTHYRYPVDSILYLLAARAFVAVRLPHIAGFARQQSQADLLTK